MPFDAFQQVKRVSKAVSRWKAHFAHAGADAADIATLAVQIDRPFLLNQRKAFLS